MLFSDLTPDFVLDAVESAGWRSTGEYLQLNSYENRVYSLRLEKDSLDSAKPEQVIAKLYRPGRWNEAAIREEHAFLSELHSQGVRVVAPEIQSNGDTLSYHAGLWLTIFPKARGRMPQEFTLDDLTRLGRVIARLHNVGAQGQTLHRPYLDSYDMGRPALDVLEPLIGAALRERYVAAAEEILAYLEDVVDPRANQRIHGDCHRGNILQMDEPGQPRDFLLIDFDDFGTGPVVQDLWMLFRHDEDVTHEMGAFLKGYTELRDFDEDQLDWMEGLRGLRIIHYAAWIARRWADPSFPALFPQFGTDGYWFDEILALEKIVAAING